MILSGEGIRVAEIITPFEKRKKHGNGMTYGAGPASYDVRLDIKDPPRFVRLYPGKAVLLSTLEQFDMPVTLLGVVHDKSSWARKFVTVQNTVLDPGWRGFLTLEITNHGDTTIVLRDGEPIAQVVFHKVEGTVKPYAGRYQDQERGPQGARL